jgi:hypothetical protein
MIAVFNALDAIQAAGPAQASGPMAFRSILAFSPQVAQSFRRRIVKERKVIDKAS